MWSVDSLCNVVQKLCGLLIVYIMLYRSYVVCCTEALWSVDSLCNVVQKLCGLLLLREKDVHYSRSCYWMSLLIGIPYALASLSRICALYYGKYIMLFCAVMTLTLYLEEPCCLLVVNWRWAVTKISEVWK